MKALYGFVMLMMVMLATACQPKIVKPPAKTPPAPPTPVVVLPAPPSLARITVATDPPGGSVSIAETGQVLQDGGTAQLATGRYTFNAWKEGYRGGTIAANVDGLSPRTVTVPLGEGYGVVSIQAAPPDTAVSINGKPKGKTPLELELPQGDYTVAFTQKGFTGTNKALKVRPGVPVRLAVELKANPTRGTATVVTQPDGGEIYLKGRRVGAGKVELGPLPFGIYPVRSVKPEGETLRRVGASRLEIKSQVPVTLTLTLDRRERLFDGRWMDEKEALAAEERRYMAQRVKNPFEITADLTAEQYRKLSTATDLDRCLLSVLRVGDRVRLAVDKTAWTVWKRDKEMTPEFQEMIRSFRKKEACTDPWAADPPHRIISAAASGDVPTAIALALHRGRTDFPLLDLRRDQLNGRGETIRRSTADGLLTLVIEGGDGVQAAGVSTETYGDLAIASVGPSGSPLQLTWRKPPRRLLAVSDSLSPLKPLPKDTILMAREKRIVPLAQGVGVTEVVRLSAGPDFEGWQRQTFEAAGPLAAQIDLTKDEMGPNEKPGEYRRTWIVAYPAGQGTTQRQMETVYRVSEDIKDFSGDKFLRRNALERGKEE